MDFLLTPNPGLVFWTTISFVALFIVLKKFAWGPILQALKVREDTIEYSLQAAEKAKADVEQLAIEHQKMMDDAKAERDKLLKDTRTLKDTIIADAKKSAQHETTKMLDAAKKQIESEKQAAIVQLKNQVAEMSIQIASAIIDDEISADDKQKALIDKYLNNANFN